MRSHTLLILISVAALGSACSIDLHGDDSITREEKRFTVTGVPDLKLRTYDGSIRLRSWDRNEVLVEIERHAADAATAAALVVDAKQDGDTIIIDAHEPSGSRGVHFGSWQSPSVSLTVTMPRHVTIEAHTGDGSITADELSGTVGLETGDGSVRVTRVEGVLTAHTGDGSIQIDNVTGRLDANSGDGSIDVDGRFEAVDVRSGDGSVRVSAADGSVLKGDWNISTGDGSISLRVPGNLDADVDAHSNDGRVLADGINGLASSRADDDSGTLKGRLGNGGHALRVRSGDGTITISRR